ncbi:MAG: UDP-3-O-(3-hydroxymyristoyl)glucosamine N-acyltransferase, partial [Acidobacteriota bacterium]|nr:UDP-3-O-(3-hydroxymyristoyl)glucosamine N-acyltransferase [Acidobacteriota bacterium]
MKYRLADLAKIVGGSVRGDADLEIESIQGLDLAGPADIAFLNHPRYRREALGSSAGAIVIDRDDDVFTQSLLVCDNPSLAVAKIVRLFFPSQVPESGIHPTAVVAADATVDPGATVGPYVTIGHRSTVGTGAVLRSHIAVGDDCHISAEVVLNPHVVLYDGTRIGERTIVHSGTILGADGFRYVYHDGVHEKVPQVGTVILEEDIEIGANSAVDRAALEVTRVGAGTKIDNHVQVAHNVQIGKACILCGGAALAGSARLGDGVVIGGH